MKTAIILSTDNTIEGRIALRFEIGEYLYFGIVPWFGKNNSDGKKSEQMAKYIGEKLLPADNTIRNIGKEKYWYWWMYLHENAPVNFMYGKEEYYKLFDNKDFEEYIKEVETKIDSVLKNIGLIKH